MDSSLPQDSNVNAILKELSDIKANLAVNSTETSNIKTSIVEIKQDIREIKTDFVTRREFNDAMKVLREEDPSKDFESRLRMLEKFRWQFAGGVGVALFVADYILYVLLK